MTLGRLILVLTLALASSCAQQRASRAVEARRNDLTSEQQAVVADLTARYHADSSWQRDYDWWPSPDGANLGDLKKTYTLDIQRRFLKDQRPIVVVGRPEDIWLISDTDYGLSLEFQTGAGSFDFSLRCAPEILAPALKARDLVDLFAVVAQVKTVRKPLLAAAVEDATEDSPASVGLMLDSADRVILDGTCIDLVKLPSVASEEKKR